MSMFNKHPAEESKAYDDALKQAARAAAKGVQQTVYWDGEKIYVRPCGDPAPEKSEVVCIAQKWNQYTVQLRFAGARSEWVHS